MDPSRRTQYGPGARHNAEPGPLARLDRADVYLRRLVVGRCGARARPGAAERPPQCRLHAANRDRRGRATRPATLAQCSGHHSIEHIDGHTRERRALLSQPASSRKHRSRFRAVTDGDHERRDSFDAFRCRRGPSLYAQPARQVPGAARRRVHRHHRQVALVDRLAVDRLLSRWARAAARRGGLPRRLRDHRCRFLRCGRYSDCPGAYVHGR